jgi:hypothetical protein
LPWQLAVPVCKGLHKTGKVTFLCKGLHKERKSDLFLQKFAADRKSDLLKYCTLVPPLDRLCKFLYPLTTPRRGSRFAVSENPAFSGVGGEHKVIRIKAAGAKV